MSVEPRQALLAHLRADPAVQEAVGTRVYQRRVPEGAQKPLIVIYPTISRVPNRILDGVTHYRARVQVTAMADSQAQTEAAANAVVAAVDGFTGLMAGGIQVIQATVNNDWQVDQDGVDEIHHHVDVIIKYKYVPYIDDNEGGADSGGEIDG